MKKTRIIYIRDFSEQVRKEYEKEIRNSANKELIEALNNGEDIQVAVGYDDVSDYQIS